MLCVTKKFHTVKTEQLTHLPRSSHHESFRVSSNKCYLNSKWPPSQTNFSSICESFLNPFIRTSRRCFHFLNSNCIKHVRFCRSDFIKSLKVFCVIFRNCYTSFQNAKKNSLKKKAACERLCAGTRKIWTKENEWKYHINQTLQKLLFWTWRIFKIKKYKYWYLDTSNHKCMCNYIPS